MIDEKRKRYERLNEELCEITFTHSVEEYDPQRVMEIVNEMEELFPTLDASELEILMDKYLFMLEEIFAQEMDEDEELIRGSDSEYIIVGYNT